MPPMPTLLVIAVLGMASAPTLAATQRPVQSLDSLRTAAREFLINRSAHLGERRKIELGAVDPRLRLVGCQQPLHAFTTAREVRPGTITVGVRCDGLPRWTVYIGARIHAYQPVLVLTRALSRGTVVATGDLRVEQRDVATLRGAYLQRPADAVGRTLRRHLAAGSVLGAPLLESTALVRRGERVKLVASSGGLQVFSHGRALADGSRGEVVAVRNLRSRRVVEGEVTAAGTVHIRM